MGIGKQRQRPPLPAPTDDPTDDSDSLVQRGRMDDSATDVATNVSRRTDATSWTIPEDGRSITVPTEGNKLNILGHGRNKSHTSLMIEYFEGGKTGSNGARPSVRVKVTPSTKRKNKSGQSDAVQITGIGKDRKPSYTRRISLGSKTTEREGHAPAIEGTEVSHSSESNVSGRPPVEVEILDNGGSDLSSKRNSRVSRDLHYYVNPSEVSSMPPDSLLEGGTELSERPHSPLIEREAKAAISEHLHAPASNERDRSLSRERITKKVLEKLKQQQDAARPVEYEPDSKPNKERRRRSSRSHHTEETMTNTESSVVSSNLSPSHTSYRSGATSKVSLTNPKLLEMVEDTVRRLILPEIDQLKNEHRTDRKRRDFDDGRQEQYGESRDSFGEEIGRRLSKSSSSPNISSKPKVVLNRYDDQPGEVLSRGDSERKKTRRSSRESVAASDRSERRSSKEHGGSVHRKKSKDSHKLKDTAAAGAAGAILTAAALRHHDSRDSESREKRKKRTKGSHSHGSRSRSSSIVEEEEKLHRKEEIPPMPFASAINESDVTRTSILTDTTERPVSRHSEDTHTPVKEVSRFSVGGDGTPSSRTPTQTTPRQLGMSHSNRTLTEAAPSSPSTPGTISAKARIAALAAAGLGGAEIRKKVEEERRSGLVDDYGSPRSQRSPAQSVSSLREKFDDPLIPQGLRPRSRLSHASASVDRNSMHSDISESSVRQTEQELDEQLRPVSGLTYDDPGTPRGEDMEEWFQKQHAENERYRQSLAGSNITDSVDGRRHTQYTNDTYDSADETSPERDIRRVVGTQAQLVDSPHGVESAVASLLEPSVLSSSLLSSSGTGASGIHEESRDTHRTNESLQVVHEKSPAPHEMAATAGATGTSPVESRWSMLREHAQNLSAKNSPRGSAGVVSPQHSESKSLRDDLSYGDGSPIRMGASGLPLADDPMPEIGHGLDEISDTSTNPPEIRGIKERGNKDRWSYDTNGFLKDSRETLSQHNGHEGRNTLLGAAAGAAAVLAAERALTGNNQPLSPRDISQRNSAEHDYSRGSTPGVHQAEAVYMDRANASPTVQHGDEGYSSAAYARSAGVVTPKGKYTKHHDREYTKEELAEYEAAMGTDDDPFSDQGKKHTRHFSANSHAMTSPPYDSATGNGIDRIQSEDVVALMDHLTVRDAQRNARDTEILVTLVRSAAEMRQEFEAMKKFIAEQDQKIMQNTDRDADMTVQKVLSGPRPMPGGNAIARSPRTSYDSEEFATKRKNIFKRALKGLSRGSNNDMGRIEDMLYQLLGDVEELKGGQGANRPAMSTRTDSLDSYDKMRAGPDSGYEPEGQAGTSSTPNQSGHLSLTPTREKHFHSGYDGRRGSINRVSTVMEGDEDGSYLDEHEARLLDNQFENNEVLLTPTQETFKRGSTSLDRDRTPEQQTPEKQRKHKSNSPSLFTGGLAKLSRWSKTTASSDPDYKRKSNQSYQTYQSRGSRSGDSLGNDGYYDNDYALKSDDRLRSTQSLTREQQIAQQAEALSYRSGPSSILTRTPSPLVPSEPGSLKNRNMDVLMSGGLGRASPVQSHELRAENLNHLNARAEAEEDAQAEWDDPKYQAHRNSLLLQHPQPRPGPTHRHQTNLEKEARTFSGEVNVPSGLTDSDLSQRTEGSDFDPAQWGSAPALSLARTSKVANAGVKDDGPLFPQAQPSAIQQQRDREDEERRESEARLEEQESGKPRHAYDRMYYSSPLGSGHLLEPIPEVRYSLETDSGHRSPEPTALASVAMNGVGNKPSPGRKITGPRPMGTRSASKEEKRLSQTEELMDQGNRSGTVRRKPVAGARGSGSPTDMIDEEEEGGWGTWKGGRQH